MHGTSVLLLHEPVSYLTAYSLFELGLLFLALLDPLALRQDPTHSSHDLGREGDKQYLLSPVAYPGGETSYFTEVVSNSKLIHSSHPLSSTSQKPLYYNLKDLEEVNAKPHWRGIFTRQNTTDPLSKNKQVPTNTTQQDKYLLLKIILQQKQPTTQRKYPERGFVVPDKENIGRQGL